MDVAQAWQIRSRGAAEMQPMAVWTQEMFKELDFRAEAANLNQARSYRDRVEIALADFMALRLVAQIAVASVARRPFTSRAAGAGQP